MCLRRSGESVSQSLHGRVDAENKNEADENGRCQVGPTEVTSHNARATPDELGRGGAHGNPSGRDNGMERPAPRNRIALWTFLSVKTGHRWPSLIRGGAA